MLRLFQGEGWDTREQLKCTAFCPEQELCKTNRTSLLYQQGKRDFLFHVNRTHPPFVSELWKIFSPSADYCVRTLMHCPCYCAHISEPRNYCCSSVKPNQLCTDEVWSRECVWPLPWLHFCCLYELGTLMLQKWLKNLHKAKKADTVVVPYTTVTIVTLPSN